MKTTLIFCGIAVLGAASLFGEKPSQSQIAAKRAEWNALPQAEREARIYKATGGFLQTKDSYKGKVAIVNAQGKVGEDVIKDAAKRIASDSKLNFEYVKTSTTEPEKLLKDTGAAAVVIVVEDPNQPIALIALEDRWAMVNVAKIGRNLNSDAAKEKFVPSRTYKEIARCACLLCGGARSQFKGNILDVKNLEELDLIENGGIPMDRVSAMVMHLHNFGVTQERKVPYFKACQQGWAPQPTNSVQQAIWDKVHNPPEKPLKIQYDPAAQKGKVTK